LIPCPILIQPFLNKEIACSYADVSKARLSNSVFTQTVCPKVRHPPKFRPQLLPCQGGVRRPDGEGTRLTVVSRRDPILTLGAGFRRRGGRAGRRDYSADFRRTQHARSRAHPPSAKRIAGVPVGRHTLGRKAWTPGQMLRLRKGRDASAWRPASTKRWPKAWMLLL